MPLLALRALPCIAALLIAAGRADAQTAPGATLTGRVLGADGRPAPGAQVVVEGVALATPRGAAADDRGRYTVADLPAGGYTVRVRALGYQPEARGVTLAAGDTATVDFTLAPRATALDAVAVVGQRRRVASATRTETELLDIPQAIQVIGQDVIRQQQVIDLKDALRNVSGVQFTGTYNGGYQFYSSRGFWMSNVSNYRRNGIMLPNFGQNYADYVESVEVLKGPAGILYGDVTPGGIINITTKQPLAHRYARAEVKTGSYGLVRPSVDLTGPLTPGGALLGRVNASYERSDSFRDQVESEAVMVAPALTWQIGERTRWNVEGSYRDDQRVGDPGLVSADGSVAGLARLPISRFLGEPSATYGYDDASAVSTFEHRLGGRDGSWRVRNVTGYNDQTRTPLNIYLDGADSLGGVPRQQYYFHQERTQWSTALDVIGTAVTGPVRHQLLVGADWMAHRSRTGRSVERRIPGAIDLFDPEYGRAELEPPPAAMDGQYLLTERRGVYAQDQASLLGDRLQLLLGLRYNSYAEGWRYDDPASRPEGERDVRERPVSPRLGVVFKPAPWLSTYGSYSEAYEINGFDYIDPTVAVPPTYGTQWEVGLKGDFFRQRLGLTLAAYQLRKDDVYGTAYYDDANPAPDSAAAERGWYTYGGALHQSRGVELDFNGRVTDRLTLTGAAAYTSAEVVRDPAYASGNWLSNTPRETFNLWAMYRPGGALRALDVGGGIFYKGKFYGSEDNVADGLVPANHTLDVTAGYEWRNYRAQLNVSNVTNRVSYLGGFGVWEPQWPRRAIFSIASTF